MFCLKFKWLILMCKQKIKEKKRYKASICRDNCEIVIGYYKNKNKAKTMLNNPKYQKCGKKILFYYVF